MHNMKEIECVCVSACTLIMVIMGNDVYIKGLNVNIKDELEVIQVHSFQMCIQ